MKQSLEILSVDEFETLPLCTPFRHKRWREWYEYNSTRS